MFQCCCDQTRQAVFQFLTCNGLYFNIEIQCFCVCQTRQATLNCFSMPIYLESLRGTKSGAALFLMISFRRWPNVLTFHRHIILGRTGRSRGQMRITPAKTCTFFELFYICIQNQVNLAFGVLIFLSNVSLLIVVSCTQLLHCMFSINLTFQQLSCKIWLALELYFP